MIIIKSKNEIEKMRLCGRITAEIVDDLEKMIEPGVRTEELDRRAVEIITGYGVRSAFKGYNGYPANICVSVNEEVVHGIPGGRSLKDGDIVSIDAGVEYDGYYGDMARTFTVGKVNNGTALLVEVSRQALEEAVSMARAGGRLFDVSHAIERRAASGGFSVVRNYVGHGIGSRLHEDPQIPNFGKPHTGPMLKVGMTLAIEAMVNMGSHAVGLLADGWTAVTKDGKASAHFEDTVAIMEDGPEVLTCLKKKKR